MEINYNNIERRKVEIIRDSQPKKVEEKAFDFGSVIERNTLGNEAFPLAKTADYLKAAKGWVYACVSVIADEIANINLNLFEKKGDKIELVNPEKSQALKVLYRANNFTTKFDLFWQVQQYLELTGEAPILLLKQNKLITDILLLRPDLITVIPGSTNYIDGYKYRVGMNKTVNLSPDDVVFLKYPDPTRPFRGNGTLQAVAKTVDIDNFSEDYNRNFFWNSAMPGSILKTDQKLTETTKDYLRHNIDKLYKGIDKAHKAIILEQGLDWKPMQMSQKDMDFLEQQRFSRDKIMGIFRVPRTAIGITDDVNRANAEATDYVFAKRTIKPKMQRLVEQLNEFYLPQFEGTENQFFDFDDPVPENEEIKLKRYESGFKNGWMTINDIRTEDGLDEIGEAGDKIYLPLGLQQVLDVKSKKKSVKLHKNNLFAKNRKADLIKEKEAELEEKIEQHIEPIIKSMINGVPKKKVKQKKNEERLTDKKIYHDWLGGKIKKVDTLEASFIAKQIKLFKEQEKEILSIMPKKASESDIKKWQLDPKKEIKRGKKELKPVLEQTIIEGSKDGYELIGMDDVIDVSNPEVQKYLEEDMSKFLKETTATTNIKLGKTLALGIEEGESIPQLRKRVTELFIDMSKTRAETIARSEVIRASNWATEKSYKDSGVVDGKIWLTAMDERTCPFCGSLDGKEINLGKPFYKEGDTAIGTDGTTYDVSYEDVQAPPLHPQCRCTIIPKV